MAKMVTVYRVYIFQYDEIKHIYEFDELKDALEMNEIFNDADHQNNHIGAMWTPHFERR